MHFGHSRESASPTQHRQAALSVGATTVLSREVAPSTTLERGGPSRLLLCCGIETRDAAAFRARLFIDDRVDQRRLARANRIFHRVAKLDRCRGQHTHATEGLDRKSVV